LKEIELKFQVPEAHRAAVRRAVATATAVPVHLQALYFDTPDRRLAQADMALRLRKEGPRWVQTLKGRGDGLMQRLEHEVVLPRSRGVPALDPALHAHTPAGALLTRVLQADAPALSVVFSTDIRRTQRLVRLAGGTQVELALDEGVIEAGGARLPVFELEFELLRGHASALPALASRWVDRHGLWLDVRSKAERGERLACGLAIGQPVKAVAPSLSRDMAGPQALRLMVGSALNQVLGNASELIDGATAEHLHQCRVGLRRLRSVLRDFAMLEGDPAPAEFARWSEELASLFRRLGVGRDLDAVGESILPALVAAGGPSLDPVFDRAGDEQAASVLREAGCNRLWLELLAWLHETPASGPDGQAAEVDPGRSAAPPKLTVVVRRRLRQLHRQVAAGAADFAVLDLARQHRVRKRLKRLRYGLDFTGALLNDKAVRRWMSVLSPAQDALGEYNNLLAAKALFESALGRHPQAWFALGWIAAERGRAVTACTEALSKLAGLPRL
jgi:inorganic triphosphatase YgiF